MSIRHTKVQVDGSGVVEKVCGYILPKREGDDI